MADALIPAVGAILVTAMICLAALRAWRDWLELKRAELQGRPQAAAANHADVGVRIELAAVKERVKKLEAIASGVDP